MAFVAQFTCLRCEQAKREVVDHTRICADCRSAEVSRARRQALASLQGLTLEERVRRLEEALYDTDAHQRLQKLESQQVRY